MDLSSSPFSFYYPYRYTYYNCTRSAISGYESNEATCMSDTQYSILVLLSEGDSDRDVIRDNCTVIKSFVVAPSTLYLYPYWSNMPSELYWSEPRCGDCVSRGQPCGFKDGNNYLVECQSDITGEGMSAKSKTTLALAIVVPAVLIMTILVAACKIRSNKNRTLEQQQSNPPEPQLIQTHPMTVTVMCPSAPPIEQANLNPIFLLGKGDVLLEPNVAPCAICLCEYKLGDILRTISDCNHYFHSDCVDEWLRTKATCPVCRKDA